MVLGKRCPNSSSSLLKRSVSFGGFVKALGRKRVEVHDGDDDLVGPISSSSSSSSTTPLKCQLKRQKSECFEFSFDSSDEGVSKLEAMPQEILIKIVCGVEHEDLKQLFHVSKAIREAAVIAKKCHFEFSTPRKVCAFRTKIDFSELSNDELDEIEAPNAPMQKKQRRALPSGKKLEEISVNLLGTLEEGTRRRGLFMDDDDE